MKQSRGGVCVLSLLAVVGCGLTPEAPPAPERVLVAAFEGRVDPASGVMELTIVRGRALQVIAVDKDGVTGNPDPTEVEMQTVPGTVGEGEMDCGVASSFCATVRLLSGFPGHTLRGTFVQMDSITPGVHVGMGDSPSGYGRSSVLALWSYGNIPALGQAQRRWVFSMPVATPFTFRGRVWADPVPTAGAAEDCDDGPAADEDGDLAANCADSECAVVPGCLAEACLDLADNDGDGDTDCDDTECAGGLYCPVEEVTLERLLVGYAHACALLSDSSLQCWGANSQGTHGRGNTAVIGDNELPSTAAPVALGGTLVELAVGGYHFCARFDTGAVKCWGYNIYGQLGYGHTNNIGDNELASSAPDVDVGGAVVELAAGGLHTCALLDTGAVKCWGYAFYGQLGYGNTTNIGDDEVPSSVGTISLGDTAEDIWAGGFVTCARLTGGGIKCWGQGNEGQLGYGNTNHIGDNELPSTVGTVSIGGTVSQLAVAPRHTCALLSTGSVRCWGFGSLGQLGYGNAATIGDTELPSSVGPVSLGTTVTQIAASEHLSCAILTGGSVRCWGQGLLGRPGLGNTQNIGDNELPSSVGPVDVGGTAVEVGVGVSHACVRLSNDDVRCWGWGAQGALGYGNTTTIGDNEVPSSVGPVDFL